MMTLPGPNRVGTMTNTGLQDPGLHAAGQDPGPPPGHVPAPPMFYLQHPPVPPLLHYQWPMPFFCNPFTGFPGMGYGMAMPPFSSPLYMDAPAYILPHSHIQAVDHRRLLHSQVHAPITPFQNSNQPRRGRPPHPPPPPTVPLRETVNSEVQTEPLSGTGYVGGALVVNSDSGHGTASNSSSSSPSSMKKGGEDIPKYPASSNADDLQFNRNLTSTTIKHCINYQHRKCPSREQPHNRATTETQQGCNSRVAQEKILSCRNIHCNMWSVSSQESIVPVCSSFQQEGEAAKERRVSIPDILMSWGGPTPQSAQPEPQREQWLSSKTDTEQEKSVFQSEAEIPVDPGSPHAEDVFSSSERNALFKIVKLPVPLSDLLSDRGEDELLDFDSFSASFKPPEERTTDGEAEVSSSQMALHRKTNVSIWSVESLAPYVPSQEWLLRNGLAEAQTIVEEPESYQKLRDPDVERRFIFSTPERLRPAKKTNAENEGNTFDIKEKNRANQNRRLPPHTCGDGSPLTSEQVDNERSSEPEAYQSPNQELMILKKIQESIPPFPEVEGVEVLSTATEEGSSASDQLQEDGTEEVCSVKNVPLCVPVAEDEMDEILLKTTRGHMVDLGVQCENMGCFCGKPKSSGKPTGRPPLHTSDSRKGSKVKEDVGLSGNTTQRKQKKYNYQGKIKGPEKHSGQQRGFSGIYSKLGKTQGANGRSLQC